MKLTFDYTQVDPSMRLFLKVIEVHLTPIHNDEILLEINEDNVPPTISITTNLSMEKALYQARAWIGKFPPMVVDLKAPFTPSLVKSRVPASLQLAGKSK